MKDLNLNLKLKDLNLDLKDLNLDLNLDLKDLVGKIGIGWN